MGLLEIDVVEIAREEIREQLNIEGIRRELKDVENDFVFWDIKKLCEKTCMSRSFVYSTFFWLEDFPKKKIGGKWMMSPKKVAAYLETWLDKQP
ncbi:hypothetical protein A0U40_13485 [[Bacillus] sp. KCTC 13219]|nr:hypothetical protein A0U40_13485 [[Bacillus] sp. KCTC 13219]